MKPLWLERPPCGSFVATADNGTNRLWEMRVMHRARSLNSPRSCHSVQPSRKVKQTIQVRDELDCKATVTAAFIYMKSSFIGEIADCANKKEQLSYFTLILLF